MILAALAAGAGLARAGYGIAHAGTQGRADRDLIKRAYQISKRRLNEAQGYTRQGMNESLNARGVLNGGANVQQSATVADAMKAKGVDPDAATKAAIAKNDVMGAVRSLKGRSTRQADWENARMASDAEAGQTGQGNTLSGQANSDLSREFYGEHQDLFQNRKMAIQQSKRDQSAATVGAIGAGIDVGTQVYNAGQLIQGALGARVQPATGDLGPTSPGVDVRFPRSDAATRSVGGNWFAGYDPVDPLGLSGRPISNDQFNVKKKGY